MSELSPLLHEISVAFGCSTNLRTLLTRLGDGMARHLPVVEVEVVRLLEPLDEVRLSAYAPTLGRRWDGRRSARYLERQGLHAPRFVTDALARVAITPVAEKLELPVGRAGLLGISFETEISVLLGSEESTEILVDVLALSCLRLGQLGATARLCRGAYRQTSTEPSVMETKQFTEIPVKSPDFSYSEIPVETLDTALIRCISAALTRTRGKIYGSDGAAELLGLKPSTLQSKMRKLGIERSAFAD